MSAMKPVSHIVLSLAGLVGAAAAQPTGPYVNAESGYSFTAPPGWRVEPGYQASGVHIVSFPPSEEGPELPDGAAAIHIIPYDMYAGTYVGSVDEWVRFNARIAQRDVTRRDLRCESRDRRRALVCIEVRSLAQLSPEDPVLVNVRLYFKLGDKWFCAFLEYHEGDSRAKSYESALSSIVGSIMAIP